MVPFIERILSLKTQLKEEAQRGMEPLRTVFNNLCRENPDAHKMRMTERSTSKRAHEVERDEDLIVPLAKPP